MKVLLDYWYNSGKEFWQHLVDIQWIDSCIRASWNRHFQDTVGQIKSCYLHLKRPQFKWFKLFFLVIFYRFKAETLTHLFNKLRFLLWISSSASIIAIACWALNSSASRRVMLSNLRGTTAELEKPGMIIYEIKGQFSFMYHSMIPTFLWPCWQWEPEQQTAWRRRMGRCWCPSARSAFL